MLALRAVHAILGTHHYEWARMQGKNTGGIYERLSDWLAKNWSASETDGKGSVTSNFKELEIECKFSASPPCPAGAWLAPESQRLSAC